MRYFLLIMFFLMPLQAWSQGRGAGEAWAGKGILIRNISIEGFVLGDKAQFTKLFKAYRGKYLTAGDMDKILASVDKIYDEQGYKELVSISYHVFKKSLTYTVALVQ